MPVDLTAQLDDAIRARLEKAAAERETTPAALVAEAVDHWLTLEEALREELEEAIREADEGRFVSSGAVHDWLRRLDEDPDAPFPEPDVFVKPGD